MMVMPANHVGTELAVTLNPTVERLLLWFKARIARALPAGLHLSSLYIFEDGNSAASWSERLP